MTYVRHFLSRHHAVDYRGCRFASMRVALLHFFRASTYRAGTAGCEAVGHRAVRQRHNAVIIGIETTAVLRARKSMQCENSER
eukprot:756818-Pleurochrysis_carterae.AAC.1